MNVRKKLLEFIIFSIFLNIIVGVFVFKITAGITYTVSDTFFSEVENLNNTQIELYVLKKYDKEFYAIPDLFQVINSDLAADEKYQVMVILVHTIQARNSLCLKNIFHLWSFYVLIGIILGYVFYLKKNYVSIDEIEKFKDKEFCEAYINSQGLPILL